MKANKLIMLFILFGITLIFLSVGVSAECVDTDGESKYTAGTCTDDTGTYTDSCDGSSAAIDWICENERCVSIGGICPMPGGCDSGACTLESDYCTDGDGGADIYTLSSAFGRVASAGESYGVFTDHCIEYNSDGGVIVDVGGPIESCDGENCGVLESVCRWTDQLEIYFASTDDYRCENGCYEGACIKESAWPEERAYFTCSGKNCFFSNEASEADGKARFVMTKVFQGYDLPTDDVDGLSATVKVQGDSESGYIIRVILEESEPEYFAPGTSSGNSAMSIFIAVLAVAFIGGYWYWKKNPRKRRRK